MPSAISQSPWRYLRTSSDETSLTSSPRNYRVPNSWKKLLPALIPKRILHRKILRILRLPLPAWSTPDNRTEIRSMKRENRDCSRRCPSWGTGSPTTWKTTTGAQGKPRSSKVESGGKVSPPVFNDHPSVQYFVRIQ
jgi:hypothetical protein